MFIRGKIDLRRPASARKLAGASFGDASNEPECGNPSAKTSPRIVLLQGPVGPFFKKLQGDLEQSGFDAWRIVFNAGDRLFSARRKCLTYHGAPSQWSQLFSEFLSKSEIDYLVVFGCERLVHREAIELARKAGIYVLSLEEGYIRPGFVTLEAFGNNRMSPHAGQLPPDDFNESSISKEVENFRSFKIMCTYGCIYFLVRNIFTPLKQRKLFHKQRPLISEAYFWIRNAYRRIAHTADNFSTIQDLLEHQDKKYFIVPLQVSDDMQLQGPSQGWSNERLILSTIESFAQHAPKTHRLVYKIHPLERGHSNHPELIRRIAEKYGIADRIEVIDGGSLGLLVRHSAGMITINSTSGLSAIFHGVPLLVIGDALYSNEVLAQCGNGDPDFDRFWTSELVASGTIRRQYLQWIREQCLVVGDFYAARGRSLVCEAVISKLYEFENKALLKNKLPEDAI